MKNAETIAWVACTLMLVIFLVILAVQNVRTMNRLDKSERERNQS